MAREKKTAAENAVTGSGARAGNKSAFVRSIPVETPAKVVVEQAKARGMVMSIAYVYSIRTAARAKSKRNGAPVPVRPAGSGSSGLDRSGRPGRLGRPGHIEDLLRAIAAELGLSRAIAVLETEQRKVRALLEF